jgi:uncharacterized protein
MTMRRSRLLLAAGVCAAFVLHVCVLRADDASTPATDKVVRVLVLTGGHGFPAKPFREVFAGFADVKCTFVEEKRGGEAFENIDNWPYDAIVLYNYEKKPSEKQRQNFLKLMDRGVGLIVLHHGVHAYRSWPEFKKIAGLTAFVSEAKDDVNFKVHVEDPQHPIVKGMQDFAVKDETYRGNDADPQVHVILTTNEPTNNPAVAWVHTYHKSRVCYFQLGHGTSVYGQKEFLAVLGNAIRWSAGRL